MNFTAGTALGSADGAVEVLSPASVTDPGHTDTWHFTANAGQVVTIGMSRIENQPDGSSSLDPVVELRDSRGFLLMDDDDSGSNLPRGPGRNAVIQGFPLPATDTYRVVARGGHGTFGPYLLTLEPVTLSLVSEEQTPSEPAFVFAGTISAIPQPAPPSFTFQGTIAAATQTNTHFFAANAGALTSIEMNRIANQPDGGGTLDPFVQLRDSRGFLLREDNDVGTGLPPGPGHNALILNFSLPATDTYSVVAKSSNGTIGPYEIRVVFGELTVQTEPATVTFPASSGTVATIHVNRVANNPDGTGTLDPAVEVRDSRGLLLGRDDETGSDSPPGPGRNASLVRVTLAATDTYSLTVRGSNGTAGPYRIEVFFEQ